MSLDSFVRVFQFYSVTGQHWEVTREPENWSPLYALTGQPHRGGKVDNTHTLPWQMLCFALLSGFFILLFHLTFTIMNAEQLTKSETETWLDWVREYRSIFSATFPSKETRKQRIAELRIRMTYVEKEFTEKSIQRRSWLDMSAKVEALKQLGV